MQYGLTSNNIFLSVNHFEPVNWWSFVTQDYIQREHLLIHKLTCILSNFCSLCLFHFHFHFQKTRKCWTGTCALNFVRFSSIFLTWICLNVNLFTKIKNPKVEDEPKSTCRYKHLVKFTSWLWIVQIEWKDFLSFFIALITQL